MNPTPKYGGFLTCSFFFIQYFVNAKMHCFWPRSCRLVPVVLNRNNSSQTPNCRASHRIFALNKSRPKYGGFLTCSFFFIQYFVNAKMHCFWSRLCRLVPVVLNRNNSSQTPNCRASHRIFALNKSRPKYGEFLTCSFFFIEYFVNAKIHCFWPRFCRLVPVVPNHNNSWQTPNCRAAHQIDALNKSRPQYGA